VSDLHQQFPAGALAAVDSVAQISTAKIPGDTGTGEIPGALLGVEVVMGPEPFVGIP
jgi:hypothetical protein